MARAGPPAAGSVTVDDWGVTRRLPLGDVEKVAWEHLTEVAIVTTDAGPFLEDVFLVLEGDDGDGCAIPQMDPGFAPVLYCVRLLLTRIGRSHSRGRPPQSRSRTVSPGFSSRMRRSRQRTS